MTCTLQESEKLSYQRVKDKNTSDPLDMQLFSYNRVRKMIGMGN